MDWKKLLNKLTSRKFWTAVASFVGCMIIAFNGGEDTAQVVAGCIMAGASVIGYLIAEGLTDAAHKDDGKEEEEKND